ncbi:MAG: hypothetical protein EA396_02865 [Anaerolineaceae bacterium]|nr:MAG: hypothetical protein EA396_02865 [Anaerolineaceae bacterium]
MNWWHFFLIFFATMLIIGMLGVELFGLFLLIVFLLGGGYFLAAQFDAFRRPNAFINYLHARNFLSQGKVNQALEHYDKALSMNPSLEVARREKAALLMMMENPAGAEQVLEEAIEQSPDETRLYQMRIRSLMNKHDYSGVLTESERILRNKPDYTLAYLHRAIAHHNMDRLSEAADDYERFIESNPRNLPAYANLAEVYISLRQPARAAELYDDAINQNARFAPAYAGRGFLRAMGGDFDAGLDDAERAVKLAPDQPGVYYGRGCVLALMDDPQAAFDDFQYALELDADYHYAIAAMAATHELGRRRLQADATWRTLVKRDRRYADVEWVLTRYGWQGKLEDAARAIIGRIE